MKLVEVGKARLEGFQGLGGGDMLWQLIPKVDSCVEEWVAVHISSAGW